MAVYGEQFTKPDLEAAKLREDWESEISEEEVVEPPMHDD
mgnify:CR=1 FL=1